MKTITSLITGFSLPFLIHPIASANANVFEQDPTLFPQILMGLGCLFALFGCVFPISKLPSGSWASVIFVTPACWIVGFSLIVLGQHLFLAAIQ